VVKMLDDHDRSGGPVTAGTFRVVVLEGRPPRFVPRLRDAGEGDEVLRRSGFRGRRHAPISYVFDESFTVVHEGRAYHLG
jgi:hypothetical protein